MNAMQWSGDLTLSNLGDWPPIAKVAAVALLLCLVLALGYGIYLKPMSQHLERLRMDERRQQERLAAKTRLAADLEQYQAKIQLMQHSFEGLLRQLPAGSEVPDLLDDITRTATGSGLVFEEIKLLAPVEQAFYRELPMQVVVIGAYHDLATFVSRLGALPRIVTLHDFQIGPVVVGSESPLRMALQARTYSYDPAEQQP